MINSTRYFQLTSEVLMEYHYSDLYNAYNQEGNNEHIVDLNDNEDDYGFIVTDKFDSTRNFYFNKDKYNLVLPVNTSESKFVQCVNSRGTFNTLTGDLVNEQITNLTSNTDDVLIDTFRLHFTSRNYFGDYDGFILRAYIYDQYKNKIILFSYYIKKTDDVVINADPILINQKLYTTYLDFRIPSVDALLNLSDLKGEVNLKNTLSPVYSIMDNTPLVFSLYGVKSSYDYNGSNLYKTEKLNSIYVPIKDSFSTLNVNIEEATDGDYFKIYPVVDSGTISFSDYIYKLSNGRPNTYIVMHEITLTEYWTDYQNNVNSEVTHRCHYIVNAASVDDELVVNEDELERVMIYRPVIMHSGRLNSFLIEDQMRIMNTLDNTTVVKIATFSSKEDDGTVICSPKKYGKHLNKIYLGEIPAQVNVYNKRTDFDEDQLKITNGGSNVTIENHQHSIIGFIESANVGVSIEQIPVEELNE